MDKQLHSIKARGHKDLYKMTRGRGGVEYPPDIERARVNLRDILATGNAAEITAAVNHLESVCESHGWKRRPELVVPSARKRAGLGDVIGGIMATELGE